MFDTQLTNYIDIKEIYPATKQYTLHTDGREVWIGIKTDENSGIILDAKWHCTSPQKHLYQKLDHFTDSLIGQTEFTSF